jgi:anthranilate synthase component 1
VLSCRDCHRSAEDPCHGDHLRLEPEIRGPYAGAIGYVGYGGDLDTAIALRTIVVRDGIAYVQAAAGIVADSSVQEETVEIDNKVAAQILAVEEANAWARR